MASISFKPKQVSKKLLSPLQDRAKDVINNRFGLEDEERKTLEAIGQKYGITRERVRQIENFAISSIKKSPAYTEHQEIFEELRQVIEKLGGVVAEEELLSHLSKDVITQNHIHLYLVLSDYFTKHKEDDHFNHRWSINQEVSDKVHGALKNLYSSLSDEELIAEETLMKDFLKHLGEVAEEYRTEEILTRWLKLSKTIGKNQLNEWGKSDSPHIKARGIKDYAFLVLRKAGKPLHFRDVAKEINKLFDKEAHIATTHNELIKDSRFVLVGRGMYGLREWGHTAGVVRDVIVEVLQEAKTPLSKEEVIEAVLKRRNVKPNTVVVNLQNEKYFQKTKDGKYKVL
jgi:hypothetical protein